MAITTLSLMEFYKISFREKARAQILYGVISGGIIFLLNFLYANNFVDEKIFSLIIPLIFFVFIVELYLNNKRPFLNIAFTLLGFIYIVLPISLTNYFVHFKNITEVKYFYDILLGIFIIIWTYDTFAYIFGVTLGRNRLFPRVSPKKSWEGAIGGSIITIIITYFFPQFFDILKLIDWMIIAGIVIITGTYGDLIESLYKRSINIKDSGSLIPGHGGMLDRFDSFLFAVPFVFIYLQFLK